jgi:hypothetical protein
MQRLSRRRLHGLAITRPAPDRARSVPSGTTDQINPTFEANSLAPQPFALNFPANQPLKSTWTLATEHGGIQQLSLA